MSVRVNAADRPSQFLLNAQKELHKRRQLAGVKYRPPTAPAAADSSPAAWISRLAEGQLRGIGQAQGHVPTVLAERDVRVSPTLAATSLDRQNRYQNAALDAPYRLYKILQALDTDGRGWLTNQTAAETLTRKDSPSYIYGRRQLKIILRRGEGLFWQRVKSQGQVRIRLAARAKLAVALGCGRLRGREVSFPLKLLLGSGRGRQADVNAALYSAVHAGQIRGKGKARPITRAKVHDISGCSKYRQRSYEKRMGVTVAHNIHILGRHSDYQLQRARIHHHLPAYKHTDFLGKINRHQRGAHYIAVRLANSYCTPDKFAVVHSQRQRTINRHLDGLCPMGSEGSDRDPIVRLYHENAATAVTSYNRDPKTSAYWPLTNKAGPRLWRKVG